MNLPSLWNIATPRPFLKIASYRKAIDLSKFFHRLTFFSFFSKCSLGGRGEGRKDKHSSYNKCHKKNMFWQTFPNLQLKKNLHHPSISAKSKRKKSQNGFLFHFQTPRLREHKCFTSEMNNEWLQYTYTFLFLEKLHIKEHFLARLTCRDMELSRVMNSLTLICTHDTQLKSPFTFLPGCQSWGKPFWQHSAKRTN